MTGPERDAPIFVVGHQRSGTTLLQALLGAHSRIAAPPEGYFFFRITDHAEHFGALADDATLKRVLHEALHPPLDVFAGAGFDEARLLERLERGPRTYRALVETILSDFAGRMGKPRWSEKSAGQPIDAFFGLFGDAQVIHIVRDPREVVASSLRVPAGAADAAAIARGWRAFTLGAIRRGAEIGPAQYLQVRYEDLTRDPAAVMRVVCAFLGEDYEPGMVEDPSRRRGTVADVASPWQERALGAVTPAREGAWRERLSRRDQARVNGVVGPLLPALGYERLTAAEKAAALPFAIADVARGRRERAGAPPAPEERYRMARAFLEDQARRSLLTMRDHR